MKITKEEYVIAYEDFIESLVIQQAQLVIEIENLAKELRHHNRDAMKFSLRYFVDEETEIFTYEIIEPKKIGFIKEVR